MAEEHYHRCRIGRAQFADRVSGLVHEGAVVAGAGHLIGEPAGGGAFLARKRRNRHQSADQFDGLLAVHDAGGGGVRRAGGGAAVRSAALIARTPMAISSSVITSGGSRRRIVGPAGKAMT